MKQLDQDPGIYLHINDMEQKYEEVADRVILINNFDMHNEDDKERLNRLLYTEYEDDILDTMPTCDCGHKRGEYNLGVRCLECGTVVVSTTEKPIESVVWMRVPEGVHAFVTPQVWLILNKMFRYADILMPRYLADPSYQIKKSPSPNAQRIMKAFDDIGWKRSINYFYEHFDEAMDLLIKQCEIKPVARREIFRQFLKENRDRIFTRFLPIPNRLIFIVERTSTGTYADQVMRSALDAVRTISSVESDILKMSNRVRENRTVKIVDQLSTYYDTYTKNNLGGKPGMYRHQVFGSRLDFSGRCVISSLVDPHRYDELHMPWGVAVMMLKLHITNKLMRLGFSPIEAEAFCMRYTTQYHPLMDRIFQELIEESPYKGLPVLFQRNPSLQRASAQMLYVTKIKTDTAVNTSSFSDLALTGPNADFDGDEMNHELLLDKKEHDAFYRLAPHFNVPDPQKPFGIASVVKIPDPVAATVGNWIDQEDQMG